ncbi:MAG TPA: hypothetical protein VGD81_11510 [Opitutaceae bacterium]
MYPREELTVLAARKALLRARIRVGRVDCTDTASAVVRPLVWIDRLHAQWRALPSWVRAGAPVVLLALKRGRRRRRPGGRLHVAKSLLRWAPIALRLWHGVRGGRRTPLRPTAF